MGIYVIRLWIIFSLLSWSAILPFGAYAQFADPRDRACELFGEQGSETFYDVLLDPLSIRDALNSPNDRNTRPALEKFFTKEVFPFYKDDLTQGEARYNVTALEELMVRYYSWRSTDLVSSFKSIVWTDERAGSIIESLQNSESAENYKGSVDEKTLLIHGAAMAYLRALRESEDPAHRRCVSDFESRMATSLERNELLIVVDEDYRARMQNIVLGFIDSFIIKDPKIFSDFQENIIHPLRATLLREASAEIDWLNQRVIAGKIVQVEEITNRQLAFLNVLNQEMLHRAEISSLSYEWTADDLSLIERVVKGARGEVSPEAREGIVRHSENFRLVQLANERIDGRSRRVTQALKDNWVTILAGVTGVGLKLARYYIVKDLVKLQHGFLRGEGAFVSELIKKWPSNLPLTSEIRAAMPSLVTHPEKFWGVVYGNQVPWEFKIADETADAFLGRFGMAFESKILGKEMAGLLKAARLESAYRDAFQASVIRLYGENSWATVGPKFQELVVSRGAVMAHDARTLSTALSVAQEEGAITKRLVNHIIREDSGAIADMSREILISNPKAFKRAMKLAHRELRLAAEASLYNDYLAKVSGVSKPAQVWEWVKLQSRKYWGRASIARYKKFVPGKPVGGLNPIARAQNFWDRITNGKGDALNKLDEAEDIVKAAPVSDRQVVASIMNKVGWALIIYSVGKLGFDVWKAYKGKTPPQNFEDMSAKKDSTELINDSEIERAFRGTQIAALKAELKNAFESAQSKFEDSINGERLMKGLPEIEVVLHSESTGQVDRRTGLVSHCYVLFKIREKSNENSRFERERNALSGILVRFRSVADGFDAEMARKLGGLKANVPSSIYWTFDAAVQMRGLDAAGGIAFKRALIVDQTSLNEHAPKIIIDIDAAKELFELGSLWELSH